MDGEACTCLAPCENETVVVVENTIYSVPRNALLWAAVSETTNPKNLQQFVQNLVKEIREGAAETGARPEPAQVSRAPT